MKRGQNKNYFIFAILAGVFLLSVGLVAAQTTPGQEGIFKRLYDAFLGGIFGGELSEGFYTNVARIFLIALVVIIVYSVTDFIPLVSSDPRIRWAFSIIVGILSFMLVKEELIKNILISYQALGIALTALVPLIVILTVTYKLRTHDKSRAYASFVNPFLWFVFVVWIALSRGTIDIESRFHEVYLGALLFGVVWMFGGNKVWDILYKKAYKGGVKTGEETIIKNQIVRHMAKIEDLSQSVTHLPRGSPERKRVADQIKALREHMKELRSQL